MKTINLIQGTPEWHAHRATHLNASDAPAMLGCSPYKTRAQLVREVATGIGEEHDDATLQRFADGHRYEALARPIAEQIIGEDLYPCVGTEGKYSASFDGLTLLEETAFEHKSLNNDLRACMRDEGNGWGLPKHYQVQMEQQLLVSGAARVLFMASKWNGDELVEERHCWYASDAALRAELVAGWEQFEADVAAYEHVEKTAPVISGRAPDTLPSLHIAVTGMVTASNLADFKASAMAVLSGINRELQTDDDFANAEQTVKWCKGVEDRLEATKQQIIGQTATSTRCSGPWMTSPPKRAASAWSWTSWSRSRRTTAAPRSSPTACRRCGITTRPSTRDSMRMRWRYRLRCRPTLAR